MSHLLAVDYALLRALERAGGTAMLADLWEGVRTELRQPATSLLFGHRAAERLRRAGLIERQGDRLQRSTEPELRHF